MNSPAVSSTLALTIQSHQDAAWVQRQDSVAQEWPVALEFNGISHAVMLATPAALEDFALGFALSEGIVSHASQVYGMEVVHSAQGATVQLQIAAASFAELKQRRRTLAGRTGCGLCGTESLAQVLRPAPPVAASVQVPLAAVSRAMAGLRTQQALLAVTGATHAAAWCNLQGEVLLLREDVGRHNALDKLIGAMARADQAPDAGFVSITSRASYEMVQKTAQAGIGLLAAVSGVTGLAVQVAEAARLTLLGFVRGSSANVYSHAWRLL